jgi:hypothetical protein
LSLMSDTEGPEQPADRGDRPSAGHADRRASRQADEAWSPADAWREGWYPDPWDPTRQRRWNGDSWTADVTRGGSVPALPATATAVADPDADDRGPDWVVPASPSTWPAQPTEIIPLPIAQKRRVAVVATLVLSGLVAGYGLVWLASDDATSRGSVFTPPAATLPPLNTPTTIPALTVPPATVPPATTPPTTSPPAIGPAPTTPPVDPSAAVLDELVLRQSDVSGLDSVALVAGGDSVSGAPTLDLCNATFPSEAQRTARRQVALFDALQDGVFSTEAVLYGKGRAAAQAFTELRAAAATCPTGPVVSPVGEPTITTTFNPAPDAAWPRVPGVDRLAYDLVQTDAAGNQSRHVAVYLRRGRALLGLYFLEPVGLQEPVAGKTTIPAIVDVFARRMAALPASAVADP